MRILWDIHLFFYIFLFLQDVPTHVMMLTFLLMAIDRYKHLKHPNKMRLPPWACTIGCWIVAFCIVLPYPVYTAYLDLGVRDKTFIGWFNYNGPIHLFFLVLHKSSVWGSWNMRSEHGRWYARLLTKFVCSHVSALKTIFFY